MRFRKLRIAFSATCLIACVLLIALWVRSYWWAEGGHLGPLAIASTPAGIGVGFYRERMGWQFTRLPSDKWFAGLRKGEIDLPSRFWGGIFRRPTGFTVFMPFWFLTLLSTIVAVAPWLPNRFTLRTLLIATTLVALMLGAIVYAVR